MTTNDTDALTERIARAYYENRVAAIESEQERQSWPAWEDHEKADADEWRDAAASALPIIAEEVRRAQAEALRETADWWAENPDADVFETDKDTRNWIRDVATEYESGDQ